MANPVDLPKEVIFSYLKSPHFRVLRTDGAVVSLGTQNTIHVSLFSERAALPQQTTHAVGADGALGPEIAERRVSRSGIVREVDIDAVMTLETAIAVRDLLASQINMLQVAIASMAEKTS